MITEGERESNMRSVAITAGAAETLGWLNHKESQLATVKYLESILA